MPPASASPASARRGCTVSSRPRSPDGAVSPAGRSTWRRGHFLGEAEGRGLRRRSRAVSARNLDFVHRNGNPPPRSATRRRTPPGTISCPSSSRIAPKPKTAGGEELPRRAFLDGAVHAEPWRGLAFGVFRDRRHGYNDPDLNFFGLTLPVALPSIETVHGPTWTVRADVHDCPDLELVLPARKEAVENAFLAEMREAARIAIYRAMAADPSPRPAFKDRARACEAGIELATPPAILRPWRPSVADVDDWREPPRLAAADHDSLVMACDPEPPEAHALWRAAERAGIAARLFEADRRLEGYDWYDDLDRVTGIAIQGGRRRQMDGARGLAHAGQGTRGRRAAAVPARRDPHRALEPSVRRRPGQHPRPAGPTSCSPARPGRGSTMPCRW